MSNWITAYFKASGVAQTGLTVLVTVYDLSDDSVDVNAQAMTEVAGGWYKYDFAAYDKTKDYSGFANSQSVASDDRYPPIEFGTSTDITTIEKVDATDYFEDL